MNMKCVIPVNESHPIFLYDADDICGKAQPSIPAAEVCALAVTVNGGLSSFLYFECKNRLLVLYIMQRNKGTQYIPPLHPSYCPTTMANSGDILFTSAAVGNHSGFLSSYLHHTLTRQHQNSSVFSLVDPNIELPTISANEVEQVLGQLQSSSSHQSSAPPISRKTPGYWLSKDDSFTPPPTKRSFGGCVTPVVTYACHQAQNLQSLQTRSSLVAALQLPPLGVGPSITSSSASPPLHAALRKQLLAPSTAFTNLTNAVKQRQENLTVRLANRAKLTASARISVDADSECTTPTRTVITQPAPLVPPSSGDLHAPQDPDERFRFICPHPRCGRRYQARIGLTRHLIKYHGENVESEDVLPLKLKSDSLQAATVPNPICNEDPSLSRSPASSTTAVDPSSSSKLRFSVRTVRVDQRSSQSLDRSKVQRRCPSPLPPSSSTRTLAWPPPHAPATMATGASCSQTSPNLLSDPHSTGGSGAKVAIVSMQHSPPSTAAHPDSLPAQKPPLQPPFQTSVYANDLAELVSTSGGALTEPWCCASDMTAPIVSAPHCSSSCCWPDDCEEFEHDEEEDFLEEDCSSDLGFGSCYYPNRPTDSLPCLLHPTYPCHFHSPPPSFHLLPRGSAVDLSTSGMTEECSSCCWTADSDFSSSLCGGHGGRHSSEDGQVPGAGGFWTSPYPRVPPTRQRKQQFSLTPSAMLSCRRFSTTGEKKMRWRRGDRHGRRRTMSSSGNSSGDFLATNSANAADSVSTARSASVICSGGGSSVGGGGGGGGDNPSSLTKGSDELVACPVHDCGLVCSGCENLCEHLKECHLPDSQNKPVRLIFACPVKSCRTFCANEAAFEAHFDAHLEGHVSTKISDFFRHTSTDNRTEAVKSKQHQRRHHIKSTSSLVDLNMDVFESLCFPVSPADKSTSDRGPDYPDCSGVTSPAKLDSPSTPVALLDDENRSLLQALDLLPDDVLHELLQEKTGGSANNGACIGAPPVNFGGCCNTPTLSNGSSGDVGNNEESLRQHLEQHQTSMIVSCSSASDSEVSSSMHSENHHQVLGSDNVVKRQRNSLTCLEFSREKQAALSRAHSTHLQSKRETLPPHTLPSASQLLFPNKSLKSHAVSTEDLFHLPDTRHQVYQKSDSLYSSHRERERRGGASYTFLKTNEWILPCHLSDTDMPPLSARLMPAPAAAATTTTTTTSQHSRVYSNRLKRRRRAFGERFYTFDSRFLPTLQNTPSNRFEDSKHT